MTDSDDFTEIIDEFLVESHENLDRLDTSLVSLEQSDDPEILAAVFRTLHSMKGTASFLGFATLERLTHAGEHLLARMRDRDVRVNEARTSALLRLGDVLRGVLAEVAATGTDCVDVPADLEADLARLAEPDVERPAATVDGALSFGDLLVQLGHARREQVDAAIGLQEAGDPRPIGELLVASGTVDEAMVEETLAAQRRQRAAAAPAETAVRVDVALLDQVVNLVGELVLARNQLLQCTENLADTALDTATGRLDAITTELQERVMQTRMQPIEQLWQRLPRVIRDVAVACDKKVRIELIGQDTELDRTVLEAIKDPLTHLIRNCVDHGIEPPEVREAAGKPATGTISLRAFHAGGRVTLEVADDGGGLDLERVRAKAVEQGVVSAAQAATLGPSEVAHLVFAAGLSTATSVTSVSGRGVGMDVVRTNIESIGGTVDLRTEPGVGTTFCIHLPQTLAIIPALLVRSGGERYAVPQANVRELLRVDLRQDPFDEVAGARVHRLRGALLPIALLSEIFGVPDADDIEACIVVVHDRGEAFGLVVDEIIDTAEIVVKPIGAMLRVVDVFAGATIMGDGRVAMILDVQGLAGVAGVDTTTPLVESVPATVLEDAGDPILLARSGGREIAIPLEAVTRLDEVAVAEIESAGHRSVVRRDTDILPVVFVDEAVGRPPARRGDGLVCIAVVHHPEGAVGLIVDEILDIVTEPFAIDSVGAGPGLLGSSVLRDRVIDVVDVGALADASRRAVSA